MIATIRHDFANHFNLEAQYTWAKAMDENSGPYSEDPYPFDPQAAYGRSDYNVANAFKLFGMWQPVLFHGNYGWLEKVAGGQRHLQLAYRFPLESRLQHQCGRLAALLQTVAVMASCGLRV